MAFGQEFVVSEQSGCLDFAEKTSLDCNHLNSNKFSHPNDNKYKSVRRAITDLVSKAVESKRDRPHSKRSQTKLVKKGGGGVIKNSGP
jgi:hypothetical protein